MDSVKKGVMNQQRNAQENPQKKKRKKKRNPVLHFIKLVFLFLFVFLFVAVAAAAVYYRTQVERSFDVGSGTNSNNNTILSPFKDDDVELNVVVFGTDDKGYHTDVILVVHFDSANEDINVLSIPRDTRVTMTPEVENNLTVSRYRKNCKITEIHAYSYQNDSTEKAIVNSVAMIEELLDIPIDHYIRIELEGFREIVDAVGGIEFDVPQNMYYNDPTQGLYINLKAGPQTLNGDKAEQLVRFRSYLSGDLQRVQVQQDFIEAFAKQVLNSESVIKNAPQMVRTLFKHVETDVTLVDALNYVKYLDIINPENIDMAVLPGDSATIEGLSYFVHDKEATQEMVDRLFRGIVPEEEVLNEDIQAISSKGKSIEVSNGGYVSGVAGKFQDMLNDEGFKVTKISTYSGTKEERTRIYVRERGMGLDLKEYFTDAEIIVDDSVMDRDIDIFIITGTEDQ